jgi:Synergist-CTERM protein sorting domain-containing protein
MCWVASRRTVLLFVLALGFVLALSGFAAAETVYSQGFEGATPPNLPADCSSDLVSGTFGAWATATSTGYLDVQPPHGGSNLAFFNSYSTNVGTSARLQLGELDLSTYENVTFHIWIYHDIHFETSDDNIQVQVSTDGGTTWEEVGDPIHRYDGTTGWAEASIDLSDYEGEEGVLLGILGNSYFGENINIDDVSVEGDSAGGGEDDDSSSGCSTGILNPLFLLLLAPLGLLLRKFR